ncbi:MAG: hypothetical protein WKF37_05460 [Bryobacteraceae bacterium]
MSFVVQHPERFVTTVVKLWDPHWTTGNKPKLIPLKNIFAQGSRSEVVSRIEHVIAEELEQCPVELIGSGAREYFDLRTGIMAVLGGVRASVNFELLNRLYGCPEECCVVDIPGGAYAVVRTWL